MRLEVFSSASSQEKAALDIAAHKRAWVGSNEISFTKADTGARFALQALV